MAEISAQHLPNSASGEVEDEKLSENATIPLNCVCSVCQGPAADHLHYGAISCYSCRAFFRRGSPKQIRCIFGHGKCTVSRYNRTNCKLCRYQRCIDVGMKPEKVNKYLARRLEREAFLTDTNQGGIDQSITSTTSPFDEKNKEVSHKIATIQRSHLKEKIKESVRKKCSAKFDKSKVVTEEDTYNIQIIDIDCGENEYVPSGKYSIEDKNIQIDHNSSKSSLHSPPLGNNDTLGMYEVDKTNGFTKEEIKDENEPESLVHERFPFQTNYTKYMDDHHTQNNRNNTYFYPENAWNQNYDNGRQYQTPTHFQLQANTNNINYYKQRYTNRTDQLYTTSENNEVSEATSLSCVASSLIAQKILNNQPSPDSSIQRWQCMQDTKQVGARTPVIVRSPGCFQETKHCVVDFTNRDSIPIPWTNSDKYESLNSPFSTSEEENIQHHFEKQDISYAKEPIHTTNYEEDNQNIVSCFPSENCEIVHSREKRKSVEIEEIEPRNISSLMPLKKRRWMHLLPYGNEHAVNIHTLPIMPFTLEEEFKVIDYQVRIEDYQNKRFNFLDSVFPMYKKVAIAHIACTKSGKKIPFNKRLEDKLFELGLDFTKNQTKKIYDEMLMLPSDFIRQEVLNSTYPALYIVMYSILEGNSNEKTWRAQHNKTLHITKENHTAIEVYTRGLENVRSVKLKDQERFTSPWAVELSDEHKFEQTLSKIGVILRDDIKLQALYHMLVMVTPSNKTPEIVQNDPHLLNVQSTLSQLIYRYLSTKSQSPCTGEEFTNTSDNNLKDINDHSQNMLDADTKTRLLISLIEDVHDCVDIVHNRSLQSRGDMANVCS